MQPWVETEHRQNGEWEEVGEEGGNQRTLVARPTMKDEEGKRGSWAGIHGEQLLKELAKLQGMGRREVEPKVGNVQETVRGRAGMIEAEVIDTSVQVVPEAQRC